MVLEVVRLTKSYGSGSARTVALRDVDLVVREPGTVAVTGPSGSGKSTLLHLLGGLDTATSGSVRVDGREVGSLRGAALVEHRRRVGFVFQRYNLLPELTALENVAVPLLPYRSEGDPWSRAAALLERVGLGDRGGAVPGELSGGEQQRVAIARALVAAPTLVLADEPTGNLDSATARGIVDLLTGIRDDGATVVVATHDPLVAARCDRVVTLRDGMVHGDVVLDEEARDLTQGVASGPVPS